MAEVTPSKRQENLERFQNRLAGYKKHSQECVRKYQHTFDALVEQDVDQTLFLKQKFLQNKEKRAAKRKLDNSSNTPSSRIESKTSIISNTNDVSSPTHAPPTLPTISSPSIPNQLPNVKQEQRDFVELADLQSDMNFDLNEVFSQDAITALISDIISEPKDNKDSLFTQNHQQQTQQQQQPPPQPPQPQQQQSLQPQRQQMVTHDTHHSHQHRHHHSQQQQPHPNNHQLASSFHQTPIKIEDVNKNNAIKNHNTVSNQQQHLTSHLQQTHQMHSLQHQQPHQAPGQPIQAISNSREMCFLECFPSIRCPHSSTQHQQHSQHSQHHPQSQLNQHHQQSPQQPQTQQAPQTHQVAPQQQQQQHQQQQQQHQHQQHQQQQHQQQHQQHPQQQQQHQQQHQQQTQHQQLQQMQQQIRQQQIPQPQKQMPSIVRPPPPEYNVNGRQNNQFQGLSCNVAQRVPQQNANFSSGAILRSPNGGMQIGNRSFSEELMLMSQQRLNCHPSARITSDMNTDWRHVVTSQQRHPQQASFRSNFVQSTGIPVHSSNINMMGGHMQQQMPMRSMLNNEQPKQSIIVQHNNYPMQMNSQMLQCMSNGNNNNGVTSATNQTYPQAGNGAGAHLPSTNSMGSLVPNNISSLHQNTHRSLEVPSTLQNNTGAMNNCNSNNVNMQDFPLDFLETTFSANDYFNFNINDIM